MLYTQCTEREDLCNKGPGVGLWVSVNSTARHTGGRIKLMKCVLNKEINCLFKAYIKLPSWFSAIFSPFHVRTIIKRANSRVLEFKKQQQHKDRKDAGLHKDCWTRSFGLLWTSLFVYERLVREGGNNGDDCSSSSSSSSFCYKSLDGNLGLYCRLYLYLYYDSVEQLHEWRGRQSHYRSPFIKENGREIYDQTMTTRCIASPLDGPYFVKG